MRRVFTRGLCAGAVALSLAPAGSAADIAMLVGTAAAPAEGLALLGDALNARGYEVYERQGATRDDVAAALREVAARLQEADRLILVFAGEARTSGPRAWLMPEGLEGAGWIDAALEGLPLDLLLDMAAEAAGRAAVVVASEAAGDDERAEGVLALAPGVGAPEPPQGVLLLAGPLEATLRLVSDRLLAEEAGGVEAALRDAPEEVAIFGFRSPEAAFVNAAPSDAPPPAARVATEPPAERPLEPPAPDMAEGAEAAEAALALDQDARRRIQERLTVLGFDTRGIDGVVGPGTRNAIAEWQRAQSLAGTGFVTAEQLRLLAALADARSAELATAAEMARQGQEAADAAFWRSTGAGGAPEDLRAYLARYPEGIYAGEARVALDALEAEASASASAEDRAAWEAAVAEDRQRAYRGYLDAYPEGAFAGEAAARIDTLRAAPDRARTAEAAAAAEAALGLPRESRALIEGQLAAVGYDVGAPDGTFDDATRRALRRFQTREGLEVSGHVNEETVRALIVESLGLR